MPRTLPLALAAILLPAMASAAPAGWSTGFNQGITEYSVGPMGGGATNLILSCRKGALDIATAIRGATPYPNSIVTFRAGTRAQDVRVGKDGWARIENAPASPVAIALWSALRGGRTLTVRYADGRSAVLPLAGASKTLPAAVCAP